MNFLRQRDVRKPRLRYTMLRVGYLGLIAGSMGLSASGASAQVEAPTDASSVERSEPIGSLACRAFERSAAQSSSPLLQVPEGVVAIVPTAAAPGDVSVTAAPRATLVVPGTGNPSGTLSAGSVNLRASRATAAQPSALTTDARIRLKTSSADWMGHHLTMIVRAHPLEDLRLLALIVSRRGLDSGESSFHWFPGSTTRSEADDLAALEHLYAVGLGMSATDAFRFPLVQDGRADARREFSKPLTHADLLAGIATARQCVADALRRDGGASPKRWRSVSLQLSSAATDDVVTASLLDASGPVVGAVVFFTRAPHLECSAKTDGAGVATCRLEDAHGDGEHEEKEAPTVASYGGDLQPDSIVLPTTAVQRP